MWEDFGKTACLGTSRSRVSRFFGEEYSIAARLSRPGPWPVLLLLNTAAVQVRIRPRPTLISTAHGHATWPNTGC